MYRFVLAAIIGLAPAMALFFCPPENRLPVGSGCAVWLIACLAVAAWRLHAADAPRRHESFVRFGHEGATWPQIWHFDDEGRRRECSLRCLGHPDGSWEECRQVDLERKRKEESQKRFGHENAPWDQICQYDRDAPIREASQQRFGHANATLEEIRAFDREQLRQRKSQKRFGHPNASWDEIKRWDRQHRHDDGSSLGTSINGGMGLKIGDNLVLEFGTGNISVRRS